MQPSRRIDASKCEDGPRASRDRVSAVSARQRSPVAARCSPVAPKIKSRSCHHGATLLCNRRLRGADGNNNMTLRARILAACGLTLFAGAAAGRRPAERLRAGAAERSADTRGGREPAGQPRIEAAGARRAAAAAQRERLVQRRRPGVLAHDADSVGSERSEQPRWSRATSTPTATTSRAVRHHAAPDAVPLGSMGGAAARRRAGRAGRGRLPGRAAGSDPARRRSVTSTCSPRRTPSTPRRRRSKRSRASSSRPTSASKSG